ncbi:MAG: hypothetical protein IKC84_02615 [Helicobacteraceae bacterium]|nr:hypothetical protein [Helicobacteraceae bacterium]
MILNNWIVFTIIIIIVVAIVCGLNTMSIFDVKVVLTINTIKTMLARIYAKIDSATSIANGYKTSVIGQ